MGVYKQINFVIIYSISSKLVTLLKVIDALIRVELTVSFKFLDFSFQFYFLFVPEMSARITSYIVQTIHIQFDLLLKCISKDCRSSDFYQTVAFRGL